MVYVHRLNVLYNVFYTLSSAETIITFLEYLTKCQAKLMLV